MNGISFEDWVHEHSINGPSSVMFTGKIRDTEIVLFHDIDNDSWAIVESLDMQEYVDKLYGMYYIVFKDEYIDLLKRS